MTRVPSIYRDLAQVLTLMVLVLCSGPVRASDWPTQAIRLVVPFAPGASNDILARALSKPLGDALGQTVVVENRPGSGGSIGANFVAKSRPDGYTLMLTSNALASASAVQDTPYDPARDFDLIARVAKSPFVIVTRRDLPARTIPELIRLAKASAAPLTYGTTGVGDNIHLATAMFASRAGIEMTAIAYKGVSPALSDLLAGRIDLLFTSVTSVKNTAAVELPILAVSSRERSPLVGPYPTVGESGIDFAAEIWWGVFAPAGLPGDIRGRLHDAIEKILAGPEFSALLRNMAAQAPEISYAQMQKAFADEVAASRAIAIAAGLR